MKRVVVTGSLPRDVEVALATRYDVRKAELRALGAERFLAEIDEPDGLVVQPGDPVTAALIDGLPPSVRVVASYSVGLDHVDLAAAEWRGLPVTNTPDVLTDATADTAMLLILGALRGATPASALLRSGDWSGWQPSQVFGRDLAGRTLGVLGAGRIGTATARRAAAFGMHLVYWSGRSRSAEIEAAGAEPVEDFGAFLRRSEVLSLHAPSTSETKGLIDASVLAQLPDGAVLVNTARGDLIVDEDVIAAARFGKLFGIGPDVFADEPDLHPGYLELPNAFLLPHVGSATIETRAAMGRKVLEGLARHLD